MGDQASKHDEQPQTKTNAVRALRNQHHDISSDKLTSASSKPKQMLHEWSAKQFKEPRGPRGAEAADKVQTRRSTEGTAETCGRCSRFVLACVVCLCLVPVLLAFLALFLSKLIRIRTD